MPEPIIIVDYDTNWPSLYEKEKARVLSVVGDQFVAIEHIGSTAVPGLAAKPIIDIIAGVRAITDADDCVVPLRSIGFVYDPYPQFPERRFFRDGSMGLSPNHLHVTEYGSDFWKDKVLFRNYLRSHPEAAQEYELLKKKLVVQYGADRERYEAYTEAKSLFIESALARARESRDVTIRPALSTDAFPVARVHISSWRTTYGGIVPDDYLEALSYRQRELAWRHILSNATEAELYLVAESSDSVILGFAGGGPERERDAEYRSELYSIYLLREYQRKGTGRELTRRIAQHLMGQGAHSMLVWVLADNPCRRFYDTLGGELVREREVEIGGRKLAEVAYGWKDITELAIGRGLS